MTPSAPGGVLPVGALPLVAAFGTGRDMFQGQGDSEGLQCSLVFCDVWVLRDNREHVTS
jgi:hypothetical protein